MFLSITRNFSPLPEQFTQAGCDADRNAKREE
jgi:hypothetical protein